MRPRCPTNVTSSLVLMLLAGCPDRTIAKVPTDQSGVESKDIPVTVNREIDILFLIDKSKTMEDEQAALTANFPRFMQVLSQIEGGLPNIHVGVISQDLGAGGMQGILNCSGTGDSGKLLSAPRIAGCSPPNGAFIEDVEDVDGIRRKNYTGSLEDTFSCIASLGPVGCGFEQHLASLKMALDGSQPANAGFLRKDAFLAVIIISDEDDCSASNPQIYNPASSTFGQLGQLVDFRCFEWGWECDEGTLARTPGNYTNCRPRTSSPYLQHPDGVVEFLRGLKDDPEMVIVATLIGPPDPVRVTVEPTPAYPNGAPFVHPSCTNGNQNASPMPRLLHFANQFPDRNTFYSLCNNDLGAGLTQVAQLVRRVIGNPCFETSISTDDLDATAPGLQLECSVSDVTNPGAETEVETAIPPCPMADAATPATNAPQPCWYVAPDPVKCEAYPTKLSLAIHPPTRVTPPNTHIRAQCVTE